MADVGPRSKELQEAKQIAERKRLEFNLASQEVQLLERYDEIERIKTNIAAIKRELAGETDKKEQ